MATQPLDLSPESAEGQHGEEVIPLVAATVVAFIGRTERGPLNEPVAIRSFEDYRRIFGGHAGFSFVSFAVQHFGSQWVVVRCHLKSSPHFPLT